MAKKIALAIAAALAALLVLVATRPGTFHVERSTTISAPPEVVFAQIDDFHEWRAWSPWEHIDPELARTYDGPQAGVGASYSWSSKNDKVGKGRMTILESKKPSVVRIELAFLEPFTATNTATFTITPAGQGTEVRWAMDGSNNFAAKAMLLVMDMDKLVGGDFEKGLASMKAAAEAKAR